MCQAVCPVFKESQKESDVTRGKIYMLEGLAGKMLTDAKGVKERVEKCLLCGTCAVNCPSGVSAVEIFVLARSILTEFIGLSAAKKAIFRGMLSHPRLFNGMMGLSKRIQGFFIKPANAGMGTYCSAALSSLIGDRHFVPLAKQSFYAKQKVTENRPVKGKHKVLFFPGCVVDKIYPNIADSAFAVLRKNEVEVSIPETQVCCGIPALASGDTKTFEALLTQNLKLFSDAEADVIVTPCATCTSTIKKVWPIITRHLNLDCQNKVEHLAQKARDISEYLVDTLGAAPPALTNGKGVKVTYHDPCHLGKSLHVYQQPRTLLQSTENVELAEMNEADVSCGNGGSFNLQHYETSTAIAKRKCINIKATGADIVATSCPACIMQLTDVLSKDKQAIPVKHVIEIFNNAV
jgi:glycolate oxidase iron-sulfur subunit